MLKKKKTFLWILPSLICIIVLVIIGLIGNQSSTLNLPADIIGNISQGEIIWQDALYGKLTIINDAGDIVDEETLRTRSGTYSFSLESGYYTAIVSIFGKIKDEKSFSVTDNEVFTESETSQLGAQTVIHVKDSDNLLSDDAWIGVYTKDAVPGVDESILWQRVSDGLPGHGIFYAASMRGSTNLFLNYAGDYTVYLFPDGGYESIACWNFSTVESDDTLAIRWDPDVNATEVGDSQGLIVINGRPNCSDEGEAVWICWGKDGSPLEDYTPIFELTSYAHYPVSGEISAHSVFPNDATEILVCEDKDGSLGSVLSSTYIQPELREQSEEEPEVTFAVLSDTHLTRSYFTRNNYNFYRALSQLSNYPLDFILDNGDITDNGNAYEYGVLSTITKQFPNIQMYYSIGNHDSNKNRSKFSELKERFLTLTGTDEVYYSFNIGDNTFIILGNEGAYPSDDPDIAYISDEQLAWLSETLNQAEGEVFIFLHQPLAETVAATFEGSDVSVSDEIKEIVDGHSNVTVISGHTHRSISGTLALRSETDYACYINDGVVSAVWDGVGETDESEGIYVEIYSDEIKITGRSFSENGWIGRCNWRISRKTDSE